MSQNVINIGFGSFIFTDKIVTVLNPDSAPIKRMIQDSKEKGLLIDATYGRKKRAVIVTTNNQIVLSAVQAETIINRVNSTPL